MTHHIVVDLGFGDSGKGAITDRLAADHPGCVVIRYTGGSQAGHNVVLKEKSHIHSSFASGALGGARSHISEYCPLSPGALVVEAEVLEKKLGYPTRHIASIDPLCPLITPYDKLWNQHKSKGRGTKDTVGMGIGAAMFRHETSPHKVFALDLLYPEIYVHKLRQVKEWYRSLGWDSRMPRVDQINLEEHYKVLDHVQLVPTNHILSEDVVFIFEGAQGVLLDRDHGFFPFVTYGDTTARNAVELLSRIDYPPAGIQYVTRSYHTRHGDGPMGKGKPLDIPDLTNREGEWQGKFRTAEMDFELLQYAFMVAQCQNGPYDKFELNITCMDKMEVAFGKFQDVAQGRRIRAWYGPERTAKCIEIP